MRASWVQDGGYTWSHGRTLGDSKCGLSNGRQHDGYLLHVSGPRLGALSVLSVLTSDDAQIGLVYLLGASAGAALAYDAERAGAPASESQPARAAIARRAIIAAPARGMVGIRLVSHALITNQAFRSMLAC